jgi:hypothetical protein
MTTDRFGAITAELERLAAEIAFINAQPFDGQALNGRIVLDSTASAKNGDRGVEAMDETLRRFNGKLRRRQ